MSGTTEVVGTEGPGLVGVNSVRIAYTSTGSVGAPLVLVHGSWGSRHNWDPVIPGLAEHYRVVAYDRRGHSESERPRGQGSFTEDVASAIGDRRGEALAQLKALAAARVVPLEEGGGKRLSGVAAERRPAFLGKVRHHRVKQLD